MVTAAKEQQFDTRPRDLGRSCGSDAMGYYRLLIDTSVTENPDGKFYHCIGLIDVVVPKNSALTRIGRSAFSCWNNLQRITNL